MYSAVGNMKMKKELKARDFSRFEEVMHALTHGIGSLLGILGFILLILKASDYKTADVISAAVFGASLVILYSASCAYHASCARYGEHTLSRVRNFFMKCDHCMIFILIVGTYTPACISAMGGWVGWTVFGTVATLCTLGIILNAIDVERFSKISLVLYILTGWTIAVASVPYFNAVGALGFAFLIAGGILYTIGVVFYKLKHIPYMHVIWHLFVLGGSIMHYIMVYFFCY